MTSGPIAVVGAGIQGVCTALELARRGRRVDLFDARHRPFTQASRAGEGKLHLGFTYALDATRRTSRLMQRGALAFVPLVEAWAGRPLPESAFSRPFWYAVHPESLLTPDEVAGHFEAVAREFVESAEIVTGRYPGGHDGPLFEHVDVSDAPLSSGVKAAFRTAERAVDPHVVARWLIDAVEASDLITFVGGERVRNVEGDDRLAVVTSDGRHGPYEQVVNAAWAGRLELDASRGIVPDRPHMFRYKVGVRVDAGHLAEDLPSATMVQGPFGDVVNRGSGRVYLSWYPVGRLGSSADVSPGFAFDHSTVDSCILPTIDAVAEWIPAVGRLRDSASAEAIGGVIFSWGERDIDVVATDLHQRFDIGPASYGNYHSVDTGKFTTAPLFAVEVARRVTGA